MNFFILLVVAMSVSLVSALPSGTVGKIGERNLVDEAAWWNFGWMSSCATNSYSWRYNGYGCFCGVGGYGTAVDDVDRCCEEHDNCYGNLEAAKGGPCPDGTDMLKLTYSYDCTGPGSWGWGRATSEVIISCYAENNNECKQALCECDKVASICFANNEFNEDYEDYDKENNCQS